ncbi:MAG: hypothetical protein K8S94_07395 [Planctomycetia bacterium]|nr:hypothetical protein [Planctomycetia bacterium]
MGASTTKLPHIFGREGEFPWAAPAPPTRLAVLRVPKTPSPVVGFLPVERQPGDAAVDLGEQPPGFGAAGAERGGDEAAEGGPFRRRARPVSPPRNATTTMKISCGQMGIEPKLIRLAASSWRPAGSSREWGWVMGILLDALAAGAHEPRRKSVLFEDSDVRDHSKPCRFFAVLVA